jgi:hypothetical protein
MVQCGHRGRTRPPVDPTAALAGRPNHDRIWACLQAPERDREGGKDSWPRGGAAARRDGAQRGASGWTRAHFGTGGHTTSPGFRPGTGRVAQPTDGHRHQPVALSGDSTSGKHRRVRLCCVQRRRQPACHRCAGAARVDSDLSAARAWGVLRSSAPRNRQRRRPLHTSEARGPRDLIARLGCLRVTSASSRSRARITSCCETSSCCSASGSSSSNVADRRHQPAAPARLAARAVAQRAGPLRCGRAQ